MKIEDIEDIGDIKYVGEDDCIKAFKKIKDNYLDEYNAGDITYKEMKEGILNIVEGEAAFKYYTNLNKKETLKKIRKYKNEE